MGVDDVLAERGLCGLNGALYFGQIDVDGGKSKCGNVGARHGMSYCDAQCGRDFKFSGC